MQVKYLSMKLKTTLQILKCSLCNLFQEIYALILNFINPYNNQIRILKSRMQLPNKKHIDVVFDSIIACIKEYFLNGEQRQIGYGQAFEKLNRYIEKKDFSCFFGMEEELVKIINLFVQQWEIYQQELKKPVQNFVKLFQLKFETVKYSQKIYSPLILAVKEIKKKIIPSSNNYNKGQKRHHLDDKISDMLLKHFIQEQETKFRREGIYFVKKQNSDMRIALSDYIAQCQSLFDDYKWQQIYLKEYHYINETQNDLEALIRKIRKQKFDENIQYERNPSIQCLGCMEFFYMNMNIYNQNINNCKMALVGFIFEISQNSSRVKYEICALLNGGGGVLLFNCSRSYLNVVPRGQFLTQKDKQQIEQRIYNYLKSIYPRPTINQNVKVTFVPIKEDPFESDHNGQMEKHGNNGCHYHKRRYIKGLFVTRIRVSPSNGCTTYLLADNETRPFIPIRIKSIFDSQKSKMQIKGSEVAKFIKKRVNQYQYEINESYSKAKKYLLSKRFSDFDHQCKKPDYGQAIHNKQEILKTTSKKSNNEKDFRFASILVCRKKRHEQVKMKLKKYNINCEIEMPFENRYQLRGMNNSAIIYHNVRFNLLLQIISYKKEFQFDGKFTMVILITDYIRLPDRNAKRMLTNDDLKSLEQWLALEYPKQQLLMWKYLNQKGETEIYLETGSRASSFFIYLIVSHNGERAIFKNPKDIDKKMVDKGGELDNFFQIYPSVIKSLKSIKFSVDTVKK